MQKIGSVVGALLLGSLLHAASIIGTVKDQSGAAVAGSAVTAGATATVTDGQGRFRFDGLKPGSYKVQVTAANFEAWERTVTAGDKAVELVIVLKLKSVTTTVRVSGRRSDMANSDPNYKSLRDSKLTKVYRVENLTLTRDAGTFTFRSGSFSFLPPVLGHVTTGVFVGEGEFHLQPANAMAAGHLERVSGKATLDESFSALVVYCTDNTFEEIQKHSELADAGPAAHEAALARVRNTLRKRQDPQDLAVLRGARRLSYLERLLNYDDIPNVEAELLAELYNPSQRGSFRAFLHGRTHADLRFLMIPSGAMPMLPASEETALLNFDPASWSDGIWYLSHLSAEVAAGRDSSSEDKRLIAPEHYKMEVIINKDSIGGKSGGMGVACELRFRALVDGARMVKFDLFPDFQVSHVALNQTEVPFIQEGRAADGSFYLDLPQPLTKNATYDLTFDYTGGDEVRSVFTLPRSLWYPRPASGANRATYDLTFHVPHGTNIVSTGKLVRESKEGGFDVSEWKGESPIDLAAFRYLGDFLGKSKVYEEDKLELGVFVSSRIEEGFRGSRIPSHDTILGNAFNAAHVMEAWFGPPGLSNLWVVVDRNSDSLPGLVFATPGELMDYAERRTTLLSDSLTGPGVGRRTAMAPTFSATRETEQDEAFSRLVARQWWGATVGGMTFHEDWLASGLVTFSTSLYDQAAGEKGEFRDHWDKAREALLDGDRFGVRPISIGPLWLGILNESSETAGVASTLNTYKGGYIFHMLRCLMFDETNRDRDFREMMRDYARNFTGHAATTEDFKQVAEKHMKPVMDLDRNGKLDWFFNDWVYGMDIPSYRMEYRIAGAEGKEVTVTAKVTQYGVSPAFRMRVPLYAEWQGKRILIGAMRITGNTTGEFTTTLPSRPQRVLLNAVHDVLTREMEVSQSK
jgi:Carboxypeptidase regulatory-like domain